MRVGVNCQEFPKSAKQMTWWVKFWHWLKFFSSERHSSQRREKLGSTNKQINKRGRERKQMNNRERKTKLFPISQIEFQRCPKSKFTLLQLSMFKKTCLTDLTGLTSLDVCGTELSQLPHWEVPKTYWHFHQIGTEQWHDSDYHWSVPQTTSQAFFSPEYLNTRYQTLSDYQISFFCRKLCNKARHGQAIGSQTSFQKNNLI